MYELAKEKEKFGAINWIVSLAITMVPLIVGVSITGNTVAVPFIGKGINLVLGWLLVIAGVISLYTFFTRK